MVYTDSGNDSAEQPIGYSFPVLQQPGKQKLLFTIILTYSFLSLSLLKPSERISYRVVANMECQSPRVVRVLTLLSHDNRQSPKVARIWKSVGHGNCEGHAGENPMPFSKHNGLMQGFLHKARPNRRTMEEL